MKKHSSLDDPPIYPFFRGYKKRTEEEGTAKKNACDVDRHPAGISPRKRLNMRSELIDQLGKCVNLLEKGALSQDEYQGLQSSIMSDIKTVSLPKEA